MPRRSDLREADDAFRAALVRVEEARREAVERATKAMSSTPGWQAAAKAAAAQAVLEATIGECKVIIAEIVEGHFGDLKDRDDVARRIREGLLDKLEPPGLDVLALTGPEATAVTPALAHHRAQFQLRIEGLQRQIADGALGNRAQAGTPQELGSARQWLDIVGSSWVGAVAVWGGARLVDAQGPIAYCAAVLVGLLASYQRWNRYFGKGIT